MISVVIMLSLIILLLVIMRGKKYFKKKMTLRLPFMVGSFYVAISIPLILKLSDNIHSVYGMLFGILNLPVIYLFGYSGIIDKIENILLTEKTMYKSNMILIVTGLILWLIVSSVIGFFIDRQREKGEKQRK